MIGKETGKVLSYAVRSKTCRICSQGSTTSHICMKNWSGSSKAMESDMAVDMAHQLKDNCNLQIQILHADNDSTTTSRLKQSFPDLEKRDDRNHTKKSISKCLYEMSKSHKELKQAEVIPYLTRCFMYAISESKQENDLQNALDRIVPHAFGDHSLCSDVKWCTFIDNPSTFRFKSLPKGEALKSPDLKKDLEAMVHKYRGRAKSLLELGSTQANENFNQMVSSKAPKSRHYGGSSSLINRVSATVLQKNEGQTYLTKVNKASLLSPGEVILKLTSKLDERRRKRRIKEKTLSFKKRRIQSKSKKKQQERHSTIKEGLVYQSNLEYSSPDLEFIPDPVCIDKFKSFVTFDLETTGFGHTCEITQIAASVGIRKYQSYVYPRCQISKASKVTGLSYSMGTNKLYLHGNEVQGKCIRTALLDFLEYLKEFDHPILVGHNIASFDVPILLRILKEFGLQCEFVSIVPAFIDTLKLSKKIFPKEEVNGCYKQGHLVETYLNVKYHAHDAVEDVNSLQQLFTTKLMDRCTEDDVYSIRCKFCKESYTEFVKAKIVSKVICDKLSKNGISLQHLQLASRRDEIGVKVILKENGIPLKKCESLLKKIQDQEELCSKVKCLDNC
ncbi:uncharacterized protein [Argopecten irradians]|uniref:uncharacterized protein n=1 Tax=Argopecten irradians TaxID=31199 RepID=UPI003714D6F2